MGRKWPLEHVPDRPREWREWQENKEVQKEWYPWIKQSARRTITNWKRMWYAVEDYYMDRCWKHRGHHRSWKKYRAFQWHKIRKIDKACTISTIENYQTPI